MEPLMQGRSWALPVLGALLSAPGAAAPICRWIDDSGRTQFAASVPDRYRSQATCTDSARYELSPADRLAAQQRAQALLAGVARASVPPASAAAQVAGSASGAPGRDTKRPRDVLTDATDCPTWWRLYDESTACFGPFRTVHGATRAEAFDVCRVIASPEPTCGPRVE
jgi:hypothetical protein